MIIHIILLSLGYSVSVTLCCLCKKSLCVSVSTCFLVTLMRVELLKVLKVVNDCFHLWPFTGAYGLHLIVNLSVCSPCVCLPMFLFLLLSTLCILLIFFFKLLLSLITLFALPRNSYNTQEYLEILIEKQIQGLNFLVFMACVTVGWGVVPGTVGMNRSCQLLLVILGQTLLSVQRLAD